MGKEEPKKVKKHICAGLLAHVDAGKTTLAESIFKWEHSNTWEGGSRQCLS